VRAVSFDVPQSIKNSLRNQLRRNIVAITSLVIAITSLSYNTWRNELSEENRTQRLVSMEVLMKLSELQQVVWHHHWDQDLDGRGNLRTGWTLVLVIRDISRLLDKEVQGSAATLWQTWDERHRQLASSRESERDIVTAIEAVRQDTLALLGKLD
jgi:hypothetical protein